MRQPRRRDCSESGGLGPAADLRTRIVKTIACVKTIDIKATAGREITFPFGLKTGHMKNIEILDFALTLEEVQAINALDIGRRGGQDPEQVNPQTFPIAIQD